MRRIDELFLKYPFYGARQMVRHLRREGVGIGRRRAARLMRLLGLQAIWRAPRTSAPHPEHRVYPYLLRGLAIERPDHVWCADITYIPVRRGFLYLVAIMDWASRHVLAWRPSNTLDAGFCTDALKEALARYGTPEIFNTDQDIRLMTDSTSLPANDTNAPEILFASPSSTSGAYRRSGKNASCVSPRSVHSKTRAIWSISASTSRASYDRFPLKSLQDAQPGPANFFRWNGAPWDRGRDAGLLPAGTTVSRAGFAPAGGWCLSTAHSLTLINAPH